MKAFLIALKDFKIRFADRKGFLMMFVMPILLTAILGAALGGVMNGEVTLPHTSVGIVILDEDQLAHEFTEDVLHSNSLKEMITATKLDSIDLLKEKIQNGDLQVGLVFPDGWSRQINEGKLKPVQFYQDPTKDLQGSIVETIFNSFKERILALTVTSKAVFTDLGGSQPVITGELNMDEIVETITVELQSIATSNESYVVVRSVGEKSLSGMQYYAAGMGAMFLLFNAMIGGKSIASERADETLGRLISTPTSPISIICGKFLGTLYYSIIQFVLFVVVTKLAFGVNWGSDYLQVLTIGLVYSFAVSGLSMLLAAIFTDEKSIDIVGNIGVQILAILGGSMIPLAAFPEALQKLSSIAPNKWALNSLLDIMSGTSWTALSHSILILFSIGAVALVLGSFKLKVR
jgi:ABC-2 type transport system permease protein